MTTKPKQRTQKTQIIIIIITQINLVAQSTHNITVVDTLEFAVAH